MARTKYTREEKRVRRRMNKDRRRRFRNEIKAQRRSKFWAAVVALGLVSLYGGRKK